uniref:Vesicle-associated membrane protein 7 n=1 Tax=Callorhinus ursinus TaxID=34884 RepID=A0A3Q7QAN3_CALUR|nr:vesicle-associated membrane protein 714-like isoform X2 [Callorhinus ursinus]
MTITYSCIANGRAVLAELALTGGSYQEAAATVLKLVLLRAEPKTIMQMGSLSLKNLWSVVSHSLVLLTAECSSPCFTRLNPQAESLPQDYSFVYHTLFIDGITYLCATDNALDTITPSAFLKNMKYNKNQDDSSISTLRSQVTDVKNIMSQNIDEILESENRLDIFTDRTNDLQTTAKESQKTRKILRRIIWWKHFRKIIILTVLLPQPLCPLLRLRAQTVESDH